MTLALADATAIASADAQVALIDAGGAGAPGRLRVYDGVRPANANAPVTSQTLLVDFTLAFPSFNPASTTTGGATAQADVSGIATVQALASGSASWFRIEDGNGVAIYDGDVTNNAGAGDIKISATAVSVGIDVSVVSLSFTQPQ